jgi:hypothetical protein
VRGAQNRNTSLPPPKGGTNLLIKINGGLSTLQESQVPEYSLAGFTLEAIGGFLSDDRASQNDALFSPGPSLHTQRLPRLVRRLLM